jgi:hypothetical protein
LGLADNRLEKRPREARIERSAALERLVQEVVDSKKKRRLRTLLHLRTLERSERRSGRLPHAFALLGIAY